MEKLFKEFENEIHHEEFESVVPLLRARRKVKPNIYLVGPTGSGKRTMAKQIARAMDLPFYSESCLQHREDLLGFISIQGNYYETQFYNAVKNGGVFFCDGIDRSPAEVIRALDGLANNRYCVFLNNELVEAHPNLIIIVAGNTIDWVDKNRHIYFDGFSFLRIYYSKKIEKHIAEGDVEVLDFMHILREEIAEIHQTNVVASTRNLLRIVRFAHLPRILTQETLKNIIFEEMVEGWNDENAVKILQSRIKERESYNKYINAFLSI